MSSAARRGDWIELEGFITVFSSSSAFEVDGVPVVTNGATLFENGGIEDLGPNVKLEVEGFTAADGTITADWIAIRRSTAIRVSGHVDAVDDSGQWITVLGVTVRADSFSRLEDDSQGVEPFELRHIYVGDYVEVSGMESPAGSGDVLAVRLEREYDGDAFVQGFVQSVNGGIVRILGVDVDTTDRPRLPGRQWKGIVRIRVFLAVRRWRSGQGGRNGSSRSGFGRRTNGI